MDFITKLPLSGGYDTILTITNTDCSKASVFIPCNEAINSEGVALLYLNNIIPHYGIPYKIIVVINKVEMGSSKQVQVKGA